ncbi:GNAT family N-acetyltransferase [Paenibacillus sp. R14(2021)]|uniref:GNAT family N-acetyltransferase n=1 Tax=Paenibacillus sp. R14(2021) TaxID=2859228 RepID=UPI001C613EB5|nr:GNAT family N-acetyltransferase [Paenibacillus sp. R14(2021)]
MNIQLNPALESYEVPDLREAVGWERRDQDYNTLLEKCNFWAGSRNEQGLLIAFGYIAGTGLQHGYLEDIIVHPAYRRQGIGERLVTQLVNEAERRGIEIITLTFDAKHLSFYERCGFTPCAGGLWRKR